MIPCVLVELMNIENVLSIPYGGSSINWFRESLASRSLFELFLCQVFSLNNLIVWHTGRTLFSKMAIF